MPIPPFTRRCSVDLHTLRKLIHDDAHQCFGKTLKPKWLRGKSIDADDEEYEYMMTMAMQRLLMKILLMTTMVVKTMLTTTVTMTTTRMK